MKKLLALITGLLLATATYGVEPPALEWDYPPAPPGQFAFEVWWSTDLTHWHLLATTYSHSLHIEPHQETFYICRAVETATGLVSDWSNRADYGLTFEQSQALDVLIQNTE